MAITVTATSAQSATLTSTSLAHSPTVAAGDLFICQIHLGNSGITVSAPSGWSTIENSGTLPEAGAQGAIFYKTMNVIDSTPMTFNLAGGTGSSYASIMCRYTSNIRGRVIQLSQFSVGSTATDNAASYTTPSITAAADNIITWGCGSEGAAAITYSSSDTEVLEIGNTDATPERVAMYVTTGSVAGSVSKTITPSITNQFGAVYFIGEVHEIPGPFESINVPDTFGTGQALRRSSRW